MIEKRKILFERGIALTIKGSIILSLYLAFFFPSTELVHALTDGDCLNSNVVVVTGTVTDSSGISTVLAILDGDWTETPAYDPGSGEYSATFNGVNDGNYSLVVSAADACGTGNTAITDPINFTVDTVLPSVSISLPTDGSTVYTSTVIVKGTASDATSGLDLVCVTLDGESCQVATISGENWSYTVSPVFTGNHTLIARATDNCGNSANSTPVTIRVEAGCPPPAPSGVVDSIGTVGEFSSLVFDSCSLPRISYYDQTNGDLKYASWNGISWDIQEVDSGGDVGQFSSLALDNDENPRISYYDVTNGDLKYASWTGTNWDIETVESGGDVGEYSAIALNSSNYPNISYHGATNRDLKYASWTGTTWNIQVVDSSGNNVGLWSSLALDSSDNPSISYYDWPNGLKCASWTGTTWDFQLIGGKGYYSSLDLAADGSPGISYYEANNVDLKYASWTGTTWNTQIVDSQGDVGSYSSLALDNNGNPRISCYDATNKDLKYAFWTGTDWVIYYVDTVEDVGSYASLALDSDSNPGISYFDNTNGDLKYYHFSFEAPNITSLSPTKGPEGTLVTISGTNFGITQGSSIVTFNGVTASIGSWSDTNIVAIVPAGAMTGPVVVTVNGIASLGMKFVVIDTTPPVWDTTTGIQEAVGCDQRATVQWNNATDASSPPVKYNIYYSTTSPIDFETATKLTDVPAVVGTDYDWEYYVTGLTNGVTYYFAVRAEDSAVPPNEDSNTVELSATTMDDTTPPTWDSTVGVQYAELFEDAAGDICSVYWNRASDPCSPVKYNIYHPEGVDYAVDCLEDSIYGYDCMNFVVCPPEFFCYCYTVRAEDSADPPNEDANDVLECLCK